MIAPTTRPSVRHLPAQQFPPDIGAGWGGPGGKAHPDKGMNFYRLFIMHSGAPRPGRALSRPAPRRPCPAGPAVPRATPATRASRLPRYHYPALTPKEPPDYPRAGPPFGGCASAVWAGRGGAGPSRPPRRFQECQVRCAPAGRGGAAVRSRSRNHPTPPDRQCRVFWLIALRKCMQTRVMLCERFSNRQAAALP